MRKVSIKSSASGDGDRGADSFIHNIDNFKNIEVTDGGTIYEMLK